MNTFQRKHYKAMVSVIRTFDIVDRVKWITTDDNYFKGLDTWNMTVKDARKLEHAVAINAKKATL